MRKTFICVSLVFFWLLLWPGAHPSDAGLRCGTNVVTEGDTAVEVLYTCGEPHYVESWVEERIKRDLYPYSSYSSVPNDKAWNRNAYRRPFLVNEHVVIERWTYTFGANRFLHYLIFENGTLTKIVTGPRSRF